MSGEWTWLAERGWLLVGVLVVAGAIAWRQMHRHHTHSRMGRALRHPDAACRRAAVGVATEQGLHVYGHLLCALIGTETDPSVRAALVDGVLRNAWEPADRPSILRLRLWAYEERSHRPAHWRSPEPDPTAPAVAAAAPAHRRSPAQRMPRHRAAAPTPFPLLAEGRR